MKSKNLNKKGITLIELIVSISLISVIVLFLYQMVITISNDRNDPDFANENQLQRAEIIKYINNEFIESTDTSTHKFYLNPTGVGRTYNDYTRISIDKVVSINVYKDKLELQVENTTKKTWKLNTDYIYIFYNIKVCSYGDNDDYCYDIEKPDHHNYGNEIPIQKFNNYYNLRINIPVSTYTRTDNYLDDIELTYMKHV